LLAATGLHTAFFVCRDDELTRLERASLPNAIVEVEDASGFGREMRIAWEDPTAMPPEPAPQGGPADLCYQALGDFSQASTRERPQIMYWPITRNGIPHNAMNVDGVPREFPQNPSAPASQKMANPPQSKLKGIMYQSSV
jgi:hypothetical protein